MRFKNTFLITMAVVLGITAFSFPVSANVSASDDKQHPLCTKCNSHIFCVYQIQYTLKKVHKTKMYSEKCIQKSDC